MVEFDCRKWPMLNTTFTGYGRNNLTTYHCMALQYKFDKQFYETLMQKMTAETRARFRNQPMPTHPPSNEEMEEIIRKYRLEKLLEVYYPDYDEEMEKAGKGYNVANLCCVSFTVEFLKLVISEIKNLHSGTHRAEFRANERLQQLMRNLCDEKDYNQFHLIAKSVNLALQQCCKQ